MRSLLLIAAVLVAGALAFEAGQKCEPGSTFKQECNTCRCSADGKIMSCTRKFCIPEVQGDDPKAVVEEASSNGQLDSGAEKEEEHVYANGQVCTPNEVKMEDCNRCKCAANGIGWFCTRKTCPPRERRAAQAGHPSAAQCTPGTTYLAPDGCNDCTCGPNGIAACTQKFCFFDEPALKTKRDVAQQQQCVPGTNYKRDCNDCFCTETGVEACTHKFCLPDMSSATKSKREAVLPSNPRAKRQVPNAEQKCVPGTSFMSADGCNNCFCTETGIAACTMRFCFAAPTAETVEVRQKRDTAGEKCVPGTRFMDKDGCNSCFCTETGHAACTEKLCLDNPRSRRSADNGELPISELAPGAPGFTCAAGKSFKYQCNTCRCDTSGQSAACTFKFCLPGEY